MPAAGAHYQFGQLAFQQSAPEVHDCISAHRDMFNLGVQGPDVLFFYRPYANNLVSTLGHSLHSEAGYSLIAPLLTHRESWTPALTAYLLGVCCHFALDRACHPFIMEVAPSNKAHQHIEAELDRLVFNTYGITAPRQTMLPKKVDVNALHAVYMELPHHQLREAARSIRGYNHLLEYGALVRTLEKILGKQGAFSEMCVPVTLPEHGEVYQIMPLFEGAIPVAVQLMSLLLSPITDENTLRIHMKENFEGATL